ncbi:pre-mRNA-processing factor 39-2 isoform X2 [Cornus florida]|uniref:pre-mRNA-processing factor 39-2 isoform X2 n=1 Tax=Cornus florida TaxID=4283 RepID=UPI00289DB946|nr:pre-mRNA-processing factor 39-2 isoform X2 [Cornus florida]
MRALQVRHHPFGNGFWEHGCFFMDNIETICLAYDSFLSKFPLCHGYWRKYANHKIRLCTVDKVVKIFERAVESATYSVGVWVDYCSFGMSVFEDPFDVRRLFKRGMSFVGKDYLCHTLWDKYIEYEFSQQQWNFLAHIYIQTFRFPIKNLHRYHDNFKKFAAILEEEMEHHNDCSNKEQSEAVPDVEVITPGDDICYVIKDLLDPSVGSLRSKALQKYLSIGEQFYQKACCLNEKINLFETHIRRPYFHVKPLDDNQLENWHHYLDFVELQEDFDWAVKLYERCLIPCANYPEFWMRYVEFMETKGGREVANFALDRATQIFLKNVPAMHLFSARYKEQIGDVSGAHAAFVQCNTKSSSYFIEDVKKEANMKKRLGDSAAAFHVYEKALEMATERQILHTVPSLYIHFSHLKYMMTGSVDAALDVIIDGIQHVPHCKILLEGLINFAMMHGGPRQVNIVDSIIAHAITPGPDLSQGLGTKDREDISLIYLEFLDCCGTIHDVRKAWNRHIKFFPHLIRNFSFEEPTSGNQLSILAVEGRKCNHFDMPDQLSSGNHSSGHPIQLPVQDQQLMWPENNAIEPDQGFTDQFQTEDDNDAQGILHPLSPNFAEESRKDASVNKPSNDLEFQSVGYAAETMESTHDLVDQSGEGVCGPMESTQDLVDQSGEGVSGPMESTNDLVHQSREDASGTSETTHDLACQGADSIASLEAPQEYCDSVNVQQDQDHAKRHLKPLSFGGLSLNPQDKESVGLVPMASFEHDTTTEICISKEILESCQNTNVDPSIACTRSSPSADSAQVQNDTDENESLSPSSSASIHNPRSTKARPQPNVPANSGGNLHQMNNLVKASEDANSRPHEHLQNQHQQQQLVSPQQQCSSAGMDNQMLMNQGHPHHPSSWRNPKVEQGSQAQNQYQAGAAQGNSTAIDVKPMQNVQQHSFVAVSQPQFSPQPVSQPKAQMSPCSLQSGDTPGHAQNSQAYNATSQYYYQQQQHMQQHYLQPYQQQQQQQQLQPQQQPDQQQLLLLQQQHYLQQQQQQQHYQPQQMQQQQYLFYLQQQQQHYQQFQQLQQQQSQQQWQQLLQQHQQQQQNHQLQQWQQLQEGYQQFQQQQLLQQQQEYEQQLQQARLRPQEEYQKLQQLALQQSQQGYQQFVQQQQMQQQQEYEQQLQQARLQPQEEYQKLQQLAEQQVQQGYLQLQQHQVQRQQQQEQLPHEHQQDEEQSQHRLQITSTQNLTWDGSYYQQGQGITPLHGTAESPHLQQESPQVRRTGTSGPTVSPHNQLQSPHGFSPLQSAGAYGPAASSPHPNHQSPQAQ